MSKIILSGNSRVRLVRRRYLPKADRWAVYDALPAPIRAALQEGAAELSPLAARRIFHRFYRFCVNYEDDPDPTAYAVAETVKVLEREHKHQIYLAEEWQPPGHGRRKPLPSPHILANATMQMSGRSAR